MPNKKAKVRSKVSKRAGSLLMSPGSPKTVGRQCTACHTRHAPPTGKNCQQTPQSPNMAGGVPNQARRAGDGEDTQLHKVMALQMELMQVMVDNFRSTPGKRKRKDSYDEPEMAEVSLNEEDSLCTDVSDQELPSPDRTRSAASRYVQRKAMASGLLPKKGKSVMTSGRDRAEVKARRFKVHWPHESLRRKKGKQVQYDQLTFPEFVLGYTMVSEQESPAVHRAMTKHLQSLCRDIGIHGWEPTRDFHGIFLNEIELGHITWFDTQETQQLKLDELWSNKARHGNKETAGIAQYCYNFNKGKCKHPGDHPGEKGGFYKHICGFCAKAGHSFRHTEIECTNKTKSEGNVNKPIGDEQNKPKNE